MKKLVTTTIALLSFNTYSAPTADVAILLDTSGSMQGLINQVRDGLWKTLNNLGGLKKDGEEAKVRLALFEYGSGIVSAESNYIQMLSPLTSDHTKIAEKLFATTASGSQEYSGAAIDLASAGLKWTQEVGDFKSIILAGNETINQGPIDAIDAAKKALAKDILVNTIFAGPQTTTTFPNRGGFGNFPPHNPTPVPPADPITKPNPIFLEWKELANIGGGKVINIDANNAIPYVESPFDEDIVKLTEQINDTYLPYGKNGRSEYDRMINLDRKVRGSGNGSYMDWGGYRGGSFGSASFSTWDLVEASKADDFDITKIEDEYLPKELQGLTDSEKISKINEMSDKRSAIENKIKDLQKQRKEFVDAYLKKHQDELKKDFSQALREMIVAQLKEKGFSL